MVTTSKAYLVLQLPFADNSKDFSPSRFEDKEVSSKPLVLGVLNCIMDEDEMILKEN